jgi:tetratricopeptide (TPR) repeat protein
MSEECLTVEARSKSPLLRGAWWLTGVLTLLGLLPSVGYFVASWGDLRNRSDQLSVGLPLMQVAGTVALIVWLGRPRSGRDVCVLVALNLWTLAVAVLCGFHLMEKFVALSFHALLRLSVTFLWGYACLGLLWVAYVVKTAKPGQRFSRRSVRIWFSTVLILVIAEPMAWWLLHLGERITFPETLLRAPAGQLRIVSLGSSTMLGHPYEPKFGVPQMVAWRVQQMYPDRAVVSENLAVAGQSLRDAILGLKTLTHRPDLIVLYGGHNEFMHRLEECAEERPQEFAWSDDLLARSPLFRWVHIQLSRISIMRSFREGIHLGLIGGRVASPVVCDLRLRRFQNELTQLAQFGQRQRIPMLWYVPAASESGFEPNRSWVPMGTSPARRKELVHQWETITHLMRQEEWSAAAELCRDGLRQQPQFAEFHFRLGECLLQVGRAEEAQRHFAESLDNDGHPLRMIHDYQRAIAEVAERFEIATVNGESALRPHTPLGVLDRSVIHDNVHPTFRGFFWLGLAGADRVFQAKLLAATFGDPQPLPDVTEVDAARKFEVGASDVAVACRRIANGLRWLSRLRFHSERRLKDADEFEEWARLIDSEEARPGERGIESLEPSGRADQP